MGEHSTMLWPEAECTRENHHSRNMNTTFLSYLVERDVYFKLIPQQYQESSRHFQAWYD